MRAKNCFGRISILALTMNALIACAGGNELPTPVIETPLSLEVPLTPQAPVVSQGELVDSVSFIDSLRVAGATVEPAGEVSQSFFSVPGQIITVNGGAVQVFEYADAATAETEAAYVSPDGSQISVPGGPISMVDWIAPPHFFKQGRIIVVYVGDETAVYEVLEAALEAQFAGGPEPQASNISASYDSMRLTDDLRAAGLAVEPGDPFTPDIFTAQGLSLMVNGAPITVYEYPDPDSAASEAAWISPDGNRMTYPDPNNPGQMVSMTNEPSGSTIHYYRRDNLIVLYVGDSPPILQALEAVLGPQFAGAPAPEPGTIPKIFGYGLLPSPNRVYADQLPLPPAWLHTGDNVIPASSGSFEIEDKAQSMVQHADGVPPPLLGQALATAHLDADQAATLIILIPYGSVRSLRATVQPWSEEPAFDSSTAQALTGEGHHREDFYNFTLEPLGQVGDALLTVTMQFDNSQARGEMTYIWRLNPVGAASNAQLTPTPATFPGAFEVVLKAAPLEGTAPLTVDLIATLNGGPDNSYELNCGIIKWEMGDGIQIPQEMTCDPWSPDIRIGRQYSMEYTYAPAGAYQAQVRMGQGEDSLSSNVITVEVR